MEVDIDLKYNLKIKQNLFVLKTILFQTKHDNNTNTNLTRMTTFIKTKFKKSDDQTNIDNYRVSANIKEYHIISKLIFLRIITPKLMRIRQLFHVKNICKSAIV